VSCTGAKVRWQRLPLEGEDVGVTFDAVKTFGTVVWLEDDCCGIHFDTPLMPSEVAAVREDARLTTLLGLAVEDRVAIDHWVHGTAR
jgi:hypothetical protein